MVSNTELAEELAGADVLRGRAIIPRRAPLRAPAATLGVEVIAALAEYALLGVARKPRLIIGLGLEGDGDRLAALVVERRVGEIGRFGGHTQAPRCTSSYRTPQWVRHLRRPHFSLFRR